MSQLSLLRGFVQWHDNWGDPITTVEGAEEWVRHIADQGFDRFYTWTTRRVTRADELKDGSVYFVRQGRTLFRMPFVRVEDDGDGWAICMRPELIRVEHKRVGMVRGWRYLKAGDAPPDICPTDGGQASGQALPAELRELGLA